jgi:hypothetical protein
MMLSSTLAEDPGTADGVPPWRLWLVELSWAFPRGPVSGLPLAPGERPLSVGPGRIGSQPFIPMVAGVVAGDRSRRWWGLAVPVLGAPRTVVCEIVVVGPSATVTFMFASRF